MFIDLTEANIPHVDDHGFDRFRTDFYEQEGLWVYIESIKNKSKQLSRIIRSTLRRQCTLVLHDRMGRDQRVVG